MLKEETFEALYLEQLRDLYDAEQRIIEALPAMAQAASSDELRAVFEEHLEATKLQVRRLERIFTDMQTEPGSNICEGVRALIAEGKLRINEYSASPVLDAALIAAAQQVEHFEICAYGTARALAQMLNHEQAAGLLGKTLEEEEDADADLTEVAESVLAGEDLDVADRKRQGIPS